MYWGKKYLQILLILWTFTTVFGTMYNIFDNALVKVEKRIFFLDWTHFISLIS